VRTYQRKAGRTVIPRGGPVCGGVTTRALRRGECRRDVIWYRTSHRGRAVVLIRMTTIAIGVRDSEIVIVIRVAGRAGSRNVQTGERPTGDGVVEGVVGPGNGIVASRTVCRRESRARRGVRGVIRCLPGGQVAAGVSAIRRLDRQIVVAVEVAICAGRRLAGGRHLVRIHQRETCGAVVKFSVGPRRDRMTTRTSRGCAWECCGHVVRNIPA
jgi:hypothetical protein